jgi:hypothetical protein
MSARRLKRGTIQPKLGKRTRRAMIRLRHAFAREKFVRWAFQTNSLPPPELESRPWRTAEWHEWHRRRAV